MTDREIQDLLDMAVTELHGTTVGYHGRSPAWYANKTTRWYKGLRLIADAQAALEPAPPPSTRLPQAGISIGYQGTYPTTSATLNLDRCQEAGAKIIRYDVTSTSHYDTLAVPLDAAIRARGMESMMILHGSTSPITAAQADTLARYVGTRATGCRLFEFCNEPDLHPRWTPIQYADAAQGFCTALRAVRPDAKLILGANWKWKTDTTGEGVDAFVQQVIARWQATTIPSFDLWSFHLYDDDRWNDPRNIWNQVYGPLPAPRIPAKTRLANAGINVGICSTENGAPRRSYTEAQQAEIVGRDFDAVADERLVLQCVYTMLDTDVATFGICDSAGNRLQAFYTYKARTGARAQATA